MVNNHLFVFPTAILGGAERVMFNIIYHLLLQQQNVTVVIMSRGKQNGWERLQGFPNLDLIIYDYASEKKAILPLILGLIQLSMKCKFNFLFSSHAHINGLLSFLKKIGFFRGAILISRESTFIFDRFFGLKRFIFKVIYRFFYGQQNLIICQTQKMKNSLESALGYIPGKEMVVIPNPVNIDYIKSSISTVEKDNIIVGCGRFIPLKKFDFLLQAFEQLDSKYAHYKLVLIGEGPEAEKLEKMAKDLGVAEKVIFTGKINNPIQWFANARVGVISSEIEGFPNVLIEMMASGIDYAISTPCTDGVYELPNIIVTADCSIGEIKKALERALEHQLSYSEEYKEYIKKERSVASFWNKVLEITRS